jgi:hypothetical protein
MRCNEAVRFIQSDIDGDLSKQERQNLSAHLAHCAQCRYEYERMQVLTEKLRALPKVDPPHSIVDLIIPSIQRGETSGPTSESTALRSNLQSDTGSELQSDQKRERRKDQVSAPVNPKTERTAKEKAEKPVDREEREAQLRQGNSGKFTVFKRKKLWVTTGALAACALILVLLYANDELYPGSGDSLFSSSDMDDEAAEHPGTLEEEDAASGAEQGSEAGLSEQDTAPDGNESDAGPLGSENGEEEELLESEGAQEAGDMTPEEAGGEPPEDMAGDMLEDGAVDEAEEESGDADESGHQNETEEENSIPTRSSVFDPADDDNVIPSPDRSYTAYQGFGEDDIRVDKDGDPYILSRNPPTPMWEVEWMEWVTDDKLYYVIYHPQKDERQYWVLDVEEREEIQLERPHPLSSTYRPQE